ncbi:MAG: hypothetical protein ACR2PQ_10135, partial [Myxococcota bacterium]
RYDVESTARRVRNFRFAEEWSMLILGGWLATVPEVPVKTGLGKLCWETAQAADVLGKRLPELRCGRKAVEASEAGNEGFAKVIEAVSEPERPDLTIEKLSGMFDVLRPHLITVYEKTIRETDAICDAPTIELLEDIVRKSRKHVTWGQEVLDRFCDSDAKRERRHARQRELEALLRDCGGVTGEGSPSEH